MSSQRLVFQVKELSLIDIDRLIDAGFRFNLKVECGEDEMFEDVEEYLKKVKTECSEDKDKSVM